MTEEQIRKIMEEAIDNLSSKLPELIKEAVKSALLVDPEPEPDPDPEPSVEDAINNQSKLLMEET